MKTINLEKNMRNLVFIITLILFLSCENDDGNDILISEGILIWQGDPAVDGCGLVLEVDSTWYFTSSQQNEFINFSEQDSGRIEVIASYTIIGEEKTVWGCTTTPVKIISMDRK